MHAHLRGSKSLLTRYQIINKPDFPSLAGEIAEPYLDMSIKVAAFTVSEKSSNSCIYMYLKDVIVGTVVKSTSNFLMAYAVSRKQWTLFGAWDDIFLRLCP